MANEPEPVVAELLPADEVPHTEPKNGAKTGKGHHPNSRKNLRPSGPGRTKGSRNRFSQEAIARFVDQYRADLAADWSKHGAEFVARCREILPQIYATMQRMRLEDELARVQNNAGAIQISWLANDAPSVEPPPAPREPPKQLVYKQPEMPADLSPAEWSILMQVLELLKRTVPSNDDRPPAEIFGILKKALLEHFRDDA